MEQKAPDRRRIVVDGSNIATEGRSLPSLSQLDEAIRAFLEEYRGFTTSDVTVVVDASFGHRIDPSERTDFEQAVEHGEMITPPAGAVGRGDGFILRIAEKSGALVLSNDSFQEFHAERPWLFEPGRLIGGKPVPGVGWIFTPRTPVRGARSRSVTGRTRRTGEASAEDLEELEMDVDDHFGEDAEGNRTGRPRATKAPSATKESSATKSASAGKPTKSAKASKASQTTKATKATKEAKASQTTKATKASKASKAEGSSRISKAAKTSKAAKASRRATSADEAVAVKATKSAKVAQGIEPAKATKATKAAKATKSTKAGKAANAAKAPVKGTPDDRASTAPEALNDPMTFLTFVAEHPVGSTFEGTVTSFTSHGAHVAVDGMICHVPLRGLADPPPKRARQVLSKGETRSFVLISLDAARRRAELALPGIRV